jgi:uncharacterized membrane protein YbjE (DUF340 family)
MTSAFFSMISLIAGIVVSNLIGSQLTVGIDSFLLTVILFLIGLTFGSQQLLQQRFELRAFLIPAGTLLGTLLGGLLLVWGLPLFELRDSLLVASGLGYYSLAASITTSALPANNISVIVLLANLLREVLVLTLATPIVRLFGKRSLSPACGAASDVCLPVIVKHCGNQFLFEVMLNAVVLTVLAPILINLVLYFFY